VVLVTLVSFYGYRVIDQVRPDQALFWKIFVAAGISFIPIVFYVAEAVEPSVYGYAVYTTVLFLSLRYLHTRGFEYLVVAGVVAALGSITRQSTIVVWIPIGLLFLQSGYLKDIKKIAQVFFPGLIVLPYFYTASVVGHPATKNQGAAWESLWRSVLEGVGPMSILNTTTPLWTLFFVLLLGYLLIRAKWSELLLLALFIPAYMIFHVINPYLWGIGRYQAEFVAPFITFGLVLLGIYALPKERMVAGAFLVVLIVTTLELNANLGLDTNYREWPKMRITTTANFPYREAFGYLKRNEATSKFVLLGGSPWYGDIVAWLGGFSFTETRQWRQKQIAFNQFIRAQYRTSRRISKYCRRRGIRYIVLQHGTRREIQHRPTLVNHMVREIEQPVLHEPAFFVREQLLGGEHGGLLVFFRTKE